MALGGPGRLVEGELRGRAMLRGDGTSKSWPHTAVDILQLFFFFPSQQWGATLVVFGSSQWE